MISSEPVMKRASPEHKNATPAAMSSGCGMSPSGTLALASRTSCSAGTPCTWAVCSM